jgi:transitional endoplasmic reticulum ATPase
MVDDKTLSSLYEAYKHSRDNTPLLMLLLRAHLEREEPERAARLVLDFDEKGIVDKSDRLVAAQALFESSHYEKALCYADADDAPTLLMRARILGELDRNSEGLEAYNKAVTLSPALEDRTLAAELGGSVHKRMESKTGSVTRLKVLSNDDTAGSELTRLLVPEQERLSFEDVGGLEALKKQITKKIILPFQKPSLFARFKKKVGGGLLLYGPPGCGKTLLARATAGECHAQFFNVAISDVLDMYIGESEQKLHALFDKARQSTPSVLFFDEIEALGGKRQFHREATSSKLVSQFLSEMDGFSQNNSGVLVLGATNVPWAVDPAFRRPGRFDRVLFVPPPDKPARKRILEILLADRPTKKNLDLDALAKKTSGYSGADLTNIVETAADEAIEASLESGEETDIDNHHLRRALADVKPTTLEWLTTARNYARYANESGQYDEVLQFLRKYGK